ncbi:unnamed protein product [Sphagnum troendelagicum]
MALHYLLPLHTLLSEGYFSSFHACALSAAAHLASTRIFSSFYAFALSAAAAHHLVRKKRYLIHDSTGLAPRHKNQSSKALNPPPFQRLERDSSEMATSCCRWSIPTLPASSSCSPRISHHEKTTCIWSSRFPKLAATDDLRDRSRKAQGKKLRKKSEEDAGSHTGRRRERPQSTAKDARSRPLSTLTVLGTLYTILERLLFKALESP